MRATPDGRERTRVGGPFLGHAGCLVGAHEPLPPCLPFSARRSAPLPVVPLVACGGTTTASNGEDSGTHHGDGGSASGSGSGSGHDSGKAHDGGDLTDGGCSPVPNCGTGGCGCGTTTTCVDGMWECSCTPCPPPVDSGNVCKPNLALCQTTPIPLSCFDGGLPDATSPNMPSMGPPCEPALAATKLGAATSGRPPRRGRRAYRSSMHRVLCSWALLRRVPADARPSCIYTACSLLADRAARGRRGSTRS